MADDRQESRGAAENGGEGPGRGTTADDHTHRFDPPAGESAESETTRTAATSKPVRQPADAQARPDSWPDDETWTGDTPTDPWLAGDPSASGPVDRSGLVNARLPEDRHAKVPQPTRPMAWSGRAGVPLPTPRSVRDAAPVEWDDDVDQADQRWWMPILFGIVALVLVGILGFGLWLIVQSREYGLVPVVRPSTSPPSASASGSPTAVPPTTRPTLSSTVAGPVPVPPVVGLAESAAEAVLDQVGLTYRLEFRATALGPPGTILETDPPAGTLVDPGEEVTLVIAEAPATPPTVPPTTAGPTTPGSTPTG